MFVELAFVAVLQRGIVVICLSTFIWLNMHLVNTLHIHLLTLQFMKSILMHILDPFSRNFCLILQIILCHSTSNYLFSNSLHCLPLYARAKPFIMYQEFKNQ